VNSWVQLVNGCGPTCPCPTPTYGGSACAGVHTSCIQTTTTSTIPATCEGTCCWWWHTTLGWIYGGGSVADPAACHGCYWSDGSIAVGVSSTACKCPKPTHEGGYCGAVAQTFCGIDSAQTSSTTTSTTTTVYGWQCYTSSTSTSTTTTNLCTQGKCTWIESEGSWVLSANTCPSECPCIEPCCGAVEPCAITWTYCVGVPSTTTSTTTTSSTTTSTTTTCPASGCMYACSEAGWQAVCDCPDPEICSPCFTEPCMESLYGSIVVCGCQTTTTTTSTTTTTTTTSCSGYCSWACGLNDLWYRYYQGCTVSDTNFCTCYEPSPTCVHDAFGGPVANTNCGPTTTSTTSTTTTTPGDCTGSPVYYCPNGGGNPWVLLSGECSSGCHGVPPVSPCEYLDQYDYGTCVPD
jgi:hypothetical protein